MKKKLVSSGAAIRYQDGLVRQGTTSVEDIFMEDFIDGADFMDYFKAIWNPRIGSWTTILKTLLLASQETCAAMEFYHNQMKLRLLNDNDSGVYQRADWLVDKLGTKVHSYFWLDEYSGKDDFARYWKDEWMSGLTSWRKSLKIPDSDVVMEGKCATVVDQEDQKRAHVVFNPANGPYCLPDQVHLLLNSFDLFPNTTPSLPLSLQICQSHHAEKLSEFLFKTPHLLKLSEFLSHSQFHSTTATSPSSSPDSLKLGFPKLDPVRSSGFASSAAAIDASPLAAASVSRVRDVVDLARHYGRCYWELSKARLSMLVVATSGTGYVLGSGNAIDYVGLCCTCAGTMMIAASANSLNQFKRLKLRRNNWDSDTYEFDEVLTKFALQKRVYEVVAKPVIE
ncbi:hypothetical protein ACSBR1_017462 [Camellia fascicularis]